MRKNSDAGTGESGQVQSDHPYTVNQGSSKPMSTVDSISGDKEDKSVAQTVQSCASASARSHAIEDEDRRDKKVSLKKFFNTQEELMNRVSQLSESQAQLSESQKHILELLEESSARRIATPRGLSKTHRSVSSELTRAGVSEILDEEGGAMWRYGNMVPKYSKLPEVEVTMNVNSLSCFRQESMTFLADFVVMLDWLDPALEIDKHYTKKGDKNKESYEFLPWVIQDDNVSMVFNPQIIVENAGKELSPMQGADQNPRIERLVCIQEDDDTVHDVLWLKKTMRFRGALYCGDNDLRLFPFDIVRMEIKLSGLKPKGPTMDPDFVSLVRKERSPRLLDPFIRARHIEKYHDGHRLIEYENGGRFALGELDLKAYGSMPGGVKDQRDHYSLIFGFQRNWNRYVFDFLIQVVMVILSIMSLFIDPFYDEALSNRAAISMMLMLTLVTFTMERPAAIEFVSCSTIHDRYKRSCVFLTVCTAVLACFVCIYCRHKVQGEGIDKEFLNEWCEYSSFGATFLDSAILACLILVMLLLHAYFLAIVVNQRHEQMIQLNNHVEDTRDTDKNISRRESNLSVGVPAANTPSSASTRKASMDWERCKSEIGKMRVKTCSSSATGFEVRECHYRDIKPWRQMPGVLRQWVFKKLRCSFCCRKVDDVSSPKSARRKGSKSSCFRDETTALIFRREGSSDSDKKRWSSVPEVPRSGSVWVLDISADSMVLQKYCILPDIGPAFRSGQKQTFSLEQAFKEMQAGACPDILRGNFEGCLRQSSPGSGTLLQQASTTSESTRPVTSKPASTNIEELVRYLVNHFRHANKQVEILVGITPKLTAHPYSEGPEQDFKKQLDDFLMHIRKLLRECSIDCRFAHFILSEHQVAMYELNALDYLMQHSKYLFCPPGQQNPKPNDVNLKPASHKQTKAHEAHDPSSEVNLSIQGSAAEVTDGSKMSLGREAEQLVKKTTRWLQMELIHELQGKSASLGCFTRTDFLQAFGDLHLGSEKEFTNRALASLFHKEDRYQERELSSDRLANTFLQNSYMLQAFIRSRLFVGVIGGNFGGSLQVSCKGGETHNPSKSRRVTQMFQSVIAAGDAQFTPEFQHEQWKQNIKEDMNRNKLQEDQRGLFVGVSAAFEAAKEARVDGYFVPKDFALDKMRARLKEVMGSTNTKYDEQQKLVIANLASVIEVIDRLLNKDAWLYFQDKWKIRTGDIPVAWAFGWYIEGEPESEDCLAIEHLTMSNIKMSKWSEEENLLT